MVLALRNDGMPTRMSTGSYAPNSAVVSSLRTGEVIDVCTFREAARVSSADSPRSDRRPVLRPACRPRFDRNGPSLTTRSDYAHERVGRRSVERTVLGRTPPAVGAVTASG